MGQHEYRQLTEANLEQGLRMVERREHEGWELVSLFPRPYALAVGARDYEVVVVIRRPLSEPPPPPSTAGE